MNQEIVLEDKDELVEESSAENCRDMQKTAEEANVVEEQAIVKPEFNEKLDAKEFEEVFENGFLKEETQAEVQEETSEGEN